MPADRTERSRWRWIALGAGLSLLVAACGSSNPSVEALASAAGGQDAGASAADAAAASAAAAPAASAAATAPTKPAAPSPSGIAKPSAPPTAKPTAAPTAKPTAKPTAAPTAKPTPKPTPTPIPDTKTCLTSDGAIKNTYPATWKTVEDEPQFDCMFFDKGPIAINPDTGYPLATIHVVPDSLLSFDAAVVAATDTKTWKGVSKTPLKVGGLPAVLIVATANGSGTYPRDTERYGYLVDWGANGVIVLQTTGPEGDPRLAADKLVLDGMAAAIVIKPNP